VVGLKSSRSGNAWYWKALLFSALLMAVLIGGTRARYMRDEMLAEMRRMPLADSAGLVSTSATARGTHASVHSTYEVEFSLTEAKATYPARMKERGWLFIGEASNRQGRECHFFCRERVQASACFDPPDHLRLSLLWTAGDDPCEKPSEAPELSPGTTPRARR
jgi:hypothetical protein